eukprot:3799134-Ditylum_brightwellii.AAC.1
MIETALAAVKTDPDTPYLVEALSGDNESYFKEAMSNAVKALKAQMTWTLIHKKHLPKNAKVVPTTWAMKIKRFSSGTF